MRIELIHPLFVHFPIALLTTGSVFRFISFFLRKKGWGDHLTFGSWLMLLMGILFSWVSVISGEFAADIVQEGLCNPGMVDTHMDLSYAASTVFSLAFLVDVVATLLHKREFFSHSVIISIATIIWVLYIAALVLLAYTGYLGSSLVYAQGAGVEKECKKKSI